MLEQTKNISKKFTDCLHWPQLLRTFLLWYAFFSLAVSDSVRGLTLLDLKDLINVEVSEMSSIFALRSFGALFGSLGTGLILDRFSRSYRFLFLAMCVFIISITTLVLPFVPSLIIMMAVSTIFGAANGAFHTAANVLLLNIWSGLNSSPYMYAMHFFFGVGGLIAPIITKPFLVEKNIIETVNRNVTMEVNEEEIVDEDDQLTIKTLYPITALITGIVIPGFMFYFLKELKTEKEVKNYENNEDLKCIENSQKSATGCKKYLLVILMSGYFFCFAGIENTFRVFTPTFAVSSALKMTRHEAADLMAIFYATFSGFRGLSIPLSTVASPSCILWTSLGMVLVATIILSIAAEISLVALQVGVAIVGAGVASMFASGMLWFKNSLYFTNKLGAVMTVSYSISSQVYTMVIGYYIESSPVVFLILTTASAVGAIVILVVANVVAYFVRKENNNKDSSV